MDAGRGVTGRDGIGPRTAQTLTTLVKFNGADGAYPSGLSGLIADAGGNLFGATSAGGLFGSGTVFEIAKTNGVYASTPTVLASFSDGAPNSLVADANGNLFGTNEVAGVYGTLFEVAKINGAYASIPTVLYNFSGGSDGAYPEGLMVDGNGNLFGTTHSDGTCFCGTVFEIPKTNGVYASTPTVLVNFNFTDGANPFSGLITDGNGNLFGTTSGAGRTDTARSSRSQRPTAFTPAPPPSW